MLDIREKNKIYLYKQIKTHTDQLREPYLETNNFKYRQIITKFRLSDHNLKIETGRYHKVPREQRVCSFCNVKEDEIHLLLDCINNKLIRDTLICNIKKVCADFDNYDREQRVRYILNPGTAMKVNIVAF